MKTMPLEEALKLAVPGPRTAKFPHCTRAGGDEFRLFPHIEVPSMFGEPGRLIVNQGGYEIPTHDAHAALLAHFYNHGPELVQAVKDLSLCVEVMYSVQRLDPNTNLTLSDAKRLLAKASTVQMP